MYSDGTLHGPLMISMTTHHPIEFKRWSHLQCWSETVSCVSNQTNRCQLYGFQSKVLFTPFMVWTAENLDTRKGSVHRRWLMYCTAPMTFIQGKWTNLRSIQRPCSHLESNDPYVEPELFISIYWTMDKPHCSRWWPQPSTNTCFIGCPNGETVDWTTFNCFTVRQCETKSLAKICYLRLVVGIWIQIYHLHTRLYLKWIHRHVLFNKHHFQIWLNLFDVTAISKIFLFDPPNWTHLMLVHWSQSLENAVACSIWTKGLICLPTAFNWYPPLKSCQK